MLLLLLLLAPVVVSWAHNRNNNNDKRRYRELRTGLNRVSWLILEASFTIACAEKAAAEAASSGKSHQASGSANVKTYSPFEGLVGPKMGGEQVCDDRPC